MLQSESVQLFGGAPGIRDAALLENALGRPQNKWHYNPNISLFTLAAAYGFGIAKSHAFVDGKRDSLLAMRAFLFANGYRFEPDEIETVTTIEGLAAGRVDELMLASWIQANVTKRA